MTRFLVRLLAALEMLGGLAGVGTVFWQVLAAPDNDPAITLAPIPAALYGFSFVAGLLLWLGRPGGRAASMAVQVLQVPKLMSPQVAFMFSVGCDFWVHYLWRDEFSLVGFELKLLSSIRSLPVKRTHHSFLESASRRCYFSPCWGTTNPPL